MLLSVEISIESILIDICYGNGTSEDFVHQYLNFRFVHV